MPGSQPNDTPNTTANGPRVRLDAEIAPGVPCGPRGTRLEPGRES
jgi:hypothetical protein